MKTGVLLLLAALHLPAALLTDRIEWGSLGGSYEFVNNPSTVTSVLGNTVTVSQQGAAFFRLNQNDGWYGNFTPGEELLWTYYGGPITFDFGSSGATAIRFQLQSDLFGAFTAQLELMDGSGNLLASTSANGQSTPMGDGSALLLSLNGTHFERATVRLLAGGDLSSFAINAVEFNPATVTATGIATVAANSQTLQSPVPEPATFGLVAVAITAVAFARKRRP